MIESFFSKIYSYRESENKHSKEIFITEIFAHCLQEDEKLLKDFLKQFNIEPDEKTTIKTQSIYDFGRPDIEINIPSTKTCILIECKIEHFERPNQLDDYKKILESKRITNRHLIYLTKYYDFRENDNKKIKFHLHKWFDIFQIINEKNSEISLELKSFIKDENMSESKNFTYSDLTALKSISGSIRKMDEVLDGIKKYYEPRIGTLSKESARSTRMKDEWYCTWQTFNHPLNYRFEIEFGFWWNDEISIGTRIYIHTSEKFRNTETYLKLFRKLLKTWDVEYGDGYTTIDKLKPIAQFIIEEDEQIPAMVDYLKLCIDELVTLKNGDPKIFE